MKRVLIAIIIIILLYFLYSRYYERFEPIYLDQMAMKNSDPMYFKYSSWERDIDGNSPRDYYLENQMNYLNGVAPGYFVGDQLYVDHTDFLNMPKWYRPAKTVQQIGMNKNFNKTLDTTQSSAGSMTINNDRDNKMEQDINVNYLQEKCC